MSCDNLMTCWKNIKRYENTVNLTCKRDYKPWTSLKTHPHHCFFFFKLQLQVSPDVYRTSYMGEGGGEQQKKQNQKKANIARSSQTLSLSQLSWKMRVSTASCFLHE